MEKLICALWAPEGEARADFGARLTATLPGALKEVGASGIRLNIRDAAVDPAAGLVQTWQAPQQDAIVQFWLPSANALFREKVDAVLAASAGRFAAWLVAESTIIANRDHPPQAGERSWGWSQASFITFRPDKSWDDCVAHWHSHHTRVAIDTQSNFEYVQNVIVRALTADAPAYDAFVEECFPLEAMSNPQAFFDAVGDEAKFAENLRLMMESCGGFIDFSKVDIIPTSQFDFANLD
ncbi:EthD domain-containing protein [Sphingobium estronivorans]|uniref:EthD domain-containing protein n=1 Tax=Sphingobium estronivorans TaxID=1577690 RepID=UPI0012398CAC|nr:EthD domain-containing protein [Sphingobium estronivorans]